MRRISHTSTNQKKAEVVILILDMAEFKEMLTGMKTGIT